MNNTPNEILDSDFKKNVNPYLTTTMKRVIRHYSLVTYKTITKSLMNYNGKLLSGDIDNIRETIKLSKLPVPLTVYHGTSSHIFNDEIIHDYVGHDNVIHLIPFTSTTLSKRCAYDFMYKTYGERKILLIINLPKNYPALWMRSLSLCKDEQELLILDHTDLTIDSYITAVKDDRDIHDEINVFIKK